MEMDVPFTAHIFREGSTYVAHVPALDVSACGETEDAARRNIRDAVRGFVEVARDTGTLREILEEGGYRYQDGRLIAPSGHTEELSVQVA